MELVMRFSWMLLPAVLTLGACGGGEDIEEKNQVEVEARAKAKAKRKAEAKAKRKAEAAAAKADPPSAEKARLLAAQGKVDEAMSLLMELVAKTPEDGEVWQALSRIGIAHGRQEALLAKFDATEAIGGQTESHHRLRAQLASAANAQDQVLLAVEHLSDAEEIAFYRAQAAKGSGELSVDAEGLDPEKAADALLLATVEKQASKRKRLLRGITLSHPAAQLFLAQMSQENGLSREATGIYIQLAQGKPQAATTYAAHLYLWGQAKDPANKARLSEALTRAAFAGGDSAKGFSHLEQAISDARRNHNASAGFALANEIHDMSAEASGAVRAKATQIFARAALDDGRPAVALTAAKAWREHCNTTVTDLQGEGEEAKEVAVVLIDQDCLEAAAWIHGIAAFQLGMSEEILAATEGLEEKPRELGGLTALLNGHAAEAEAALSNESAQDGITLLFAKARAQEAQRKDPSATLRQAINAADKSAFNPDRVRTRLTLANVLMEREEKGALSTLLNDLDRIATRLGDKGAALRAETRARRIMAGIRASGQGDSLPASVAFTALASSTDVPEETDGEHRLFKWARARAAMANGDISVAIAAYASAAKATPPLFRGPWSNLSVLNGRSGPGIEHDLNTILAMGMADNGLLALPLHDWWHEREMMDVAFAIGDDPSVALPVDQRIALNAAHKALQTRSAQWLAGVGEAPTEAEAALDAAHALALENKSYSRGLPGAPMDYSTVPSKVRSKAILSYRLGEKSGDAIVVTRSGSRLVRLENVPRIRANAKTMRQLLATGEAHGGGIGLIPGRAAAQPLAIVGDALRADLLDIFTQELANIGIYLLLLDDDLYGFSFSVFPEQKDAARFVADIRSMAVSHTAGSALRDPTGIKMNYGADILALSPFRPTPDPKVGSLSIPGEAQNASRLFGQGVRLSKEGDEAKVSLLAEKFDDARFIHLSDFRAGDKGGFQLADGTMSLADVRGKDISTRVTVLSAEIDPRILMRQAHAVYVAGANNVLLSNRLIEEHVRGRILYNFYEAITRERPPVLAISEARKSLSGDSNYNGYFDPSWWGQFLLYGNP
jgi:hypothetical protein